METNISPKNKLEEYPNESGRVLLMLVTTMDLLDPQSKTRSTREVDQVSYMSLRRLWSR